MTIALALIFQRHCSNYLIVLAAVNSLCWKLLKKYVNIASLISTHRLDESSLILWRWCRNWRDSPQRRVFFWITFNWSETGYQGVSTPDLIRNLLQCIDYQQHLRRTQSDWESRWQNVEELITFASEIKTDDIQDEDDLMEQYVPSLVSTMTWSTEYRPTPLRLFLQASMLSSEGDNQNEVNNKEVGIFFSITRLADQMIESHNCYLPCCKGPWMAGCIYPRR